MKKWIAMCILVVLIIGMVLISGCTSSGSSSSNDVIITKDINSTGLIMSDILRGKDSLGNEVITYKGNCITTPATFQIAKFTTIEVAKTSYQSFNSAPWDTGTKQSLNLGNEGFSEMNPGMYYGVIYRRGNILVVISSTTLKQGKECAQDIDNKLKQ